MSNGTNGGTNGTYFKSVGNNRKSTENKNGCDKGGYKTNSS
jgi:hypothetical protein